MTIIYTAIRKFFINECQRDNTRFAVDGSYWSLIGNKMTCQPVKCGHTVERCL